MLAERVLLKIVYVLTCRILGLIVVLIRGHQATAAEVLVLRHENEVLRRHAGRVRYDQADRACFAALPENRHLLRRARRLGTPSPTAQASRGGGNNGGYYCSSPFDRQMREASQLELNDPAKAADTWTAIDRQLTDNAIWVPTVNEREVDLVSKRLHNYAYNPVWDSSPTKAGSASQTIDRQDLG